MKKIFMFTLAVLSSISILNAEILDLGGKRIEIVDGTITNKDAKIVFTKYRSLYKRGKYCYAKNIMDKFIHYYKGNKLPEAYFLRAKAQFMCGLNEKSHMRSYILRTYYGFLKLYDTYPDSKIVKKGLLVKTLKKAIIKLIEIETYHRPLTNNTFLLDEIVMFSALYQFITNQQLKEVDDFLNKKYTKDITYIFQLQNTQEKCAKEMYYKFNTDYLKCDNCLITYKISWKAFKGNLILNSIWSTLFNEIDYVYGNKYTLFKTASIKILKYDRIYYIPMQKIEEKLIKKILKLDIPLSSIKDHWREVNVTFPFYFYEYIKEYADKGKKITIDLGERCKYMIKIKKLKTSTCFKRNFLGMKQNSMIKMSITFPPLKYLIITKHGSLYDWVGLKKVDDAL